MLDTLGKLLAFQDGKTRLGLFFILLGSLATSGLELAGIGLIFPLLQAALAPDQLKNLPWVGPYLHDWFAAASMTTLVWASVLIFLFFALKNLSIYWLVYAQKRFIFRCEAGFRAKVYASYLRRPYADTFHLNTAEISRNLMRSVTQMYSKALMPLVELVMEGLIAFGAIAALLLIEPMGSMMAFAIVASSLFAFYWFAQRKLAYWGHALEDIATRLYRLISEGIGAIKEIKVLEREPFFETAFQAQSEKFADYSYRVTAIQQAPRLIGEVAILAVMFLIVAMFVLREGSITGALPVLGAFAAASLRILPSMSRIVQSIASIRQASASVNYVYAEMSAIRHIDLVRHERRLAQAPFPAWAEIRFDQVGYIYPGARQPALSDISFTLKRGETLAIVGPSGSGKSTLADILLGLLEPTQGAVLAAGESIHANLQAWRKQVGFVPQGTHVLDDTLTRNIAFGLPDEAIDMARVQASLKMTRLDNLLGQSLALDQPLGELGKRLSGGQRQRIGIARALYEDPDLLVLDEATSALDNATEQEVSQAILDLGASKTLVIIAHRLSTVSKADRLLYLKDGKILACGTYDELLSGCPDFARQIELGTLDGSGKAGA